MARGLRLTYHGAIHHVMARATDKRKFFVDEDDRFVFLELMQATKERYDIEWQMFVQMTSHFHAKVKTPHANISVAMQFMLARYAEWWNSRRGRRGHLLDARFESPLIEDGRYALRVISYIALNPVKANYVQHASDWRWASHRALAGFETPPEFLEIDWLRNFFDGPTLSDCRRQYQRFVDQSENAPPEGVDPVANGSPQFTSRIRALVGETMSTSIVPRSYRAIGRPSLGSLFAEVSDPERRDRAILRAQVLYGYTQSEIARNLRLHPNTISKITRRTRRQTHHVVRMP